MKVTESRKRIGRHLQRLRKDAGFKSAAQFAEFIGINVGTYTAYEQGKSMFDYEQAWIMADALRCSLDELGGRQWGPGVQPLYADIRQAQMNASYETLSDDAKSAASAAVEGIAHAQALQKTEGKALTPAHPLTA